LKSLYDVNGEAENNTDYSTQEMNENAIVVHDSLPAIDCTD